MMGLRRWAAGWHLVPSAGRRLLAAAGNTSKLLLASGCLSVVAFLWFALNFDHLIAPPVLLWVPTALATVVLAAVFARTSRAGHLPPPTRRFWRHMTAVGILVGAGTLSQAYDVLTNPFAFGAHTPPAMLALDGLGVLMIIYALYRLPLGVRTTGQRVQVILDAGTVLAAAAIFIWHFLTAPLLELGAERANTLIGATVLSLVGLVAVFAVAKVALAGYTFIDKSALQLFGLAMLVGALSPLPQGFLQDRPHMIYTQISIPAVMFFAAWAGERQRLAGRDQAPTRRSPVEPTRRPYSVLPYVAVAAVDTLLIMDTWSGDDVDKVVVIGAVALTFVVVLRQLTAFQENRRLLDRLNHGATHDALTKLPNRALFAERLQKATAGEGEGVFSVVLIDLDDFKVVNDNLGHEVGDALLIAVAERLAGCVRIADTVARLGGDEFVLLLDGSAAEAAEIAVQRIVTSLAKPVVADGHELLIRASIGIAGGKAGDTPSTLMRHADIAMYGAKSLDGSRYLHYQPGMAGAVADNAQVSADLRRAIEDDQLHLLYQPIVALDDGRLTGVEALVRWTHPERGPLSPAEFIPAAERNGLIVPLGRWVLRAACAQVAAWSAQHGDAAPRVLNVNVSARELREPGFADDVAAILAQTGVAGHRLAVEVTETTVLEMGPSVENLRKLRALGIRIALDDFGTGYSTLTLLQDCPVDELKLDRSFTQVPDGADPMVAAAVIHLATAMRLDVVAEGVESPAQADRLRRLGYRAAQGYLFARPLPAAEVSGMIADLRTAAPQAA
jgi:diguanylate cyclase (GGDEF)-like protein